MDVVSLVPMVPFQLYVGINIGRPGKPQEACAFYLEVTSKAMNSENGCTQEMLNSTEANLMKFHT